MKLTDLRLSTQQLLKLARGIHNSRVLNKLVLKKISRENGGLWYLANAVKHCASIRHIVFNAVRMRACHYEMITHTMLANVNITALTIISGRRFLHSIDIIGEYLVNRTTLTSLRLSAVRLDDLLLAIANDHD